MKIILYVESNFAFYVIFLTITDENIQNAQKHKTKLVKRGEVGMCALISLNVYDIILAVEKRETELRCKSVPFRFG